MYEILKPVSCKTVYATTLLTEWFENFIHHFIHDLNYRFDGQISLFDLEGWCEEHPNDLTWFLSQGFIGKVKPKFVGFNLPIETEEEAARIKYWLVTSIAG